jgi:mono/diheme cytochrome c family protein
MKAIKFGVIVLSAFVFINNLYSTATAGQPAQSSLKSSIARGKELYLLQCLACHQVDGGGVPHLNAPLDGSANVKGKDKSKLIKVVLNGLKGEEIEGENYSNVMAPHKELTDQQIADILTYVRNAWSNKASQVSAAEVKAVRAKLK